MESFPYISVGPSPISSVKPFSHISLESFLQVFVEFSPLLSAKSFLQILAVSFFQIFELSFPKVFVKSFQILKWPSTDFSKSRTQILLKSLPRNLSTFLPSDLNGVLSKAQWSTSPLNPCRVHPPRFPLSFSPRSL